MSEFFRTAVYTKNIPAAERSLRLLAALAVLTSTFYLTEPWLRWAAGATAAMFALTAVFGFCPACYFAGRKLQGH